MILELERMVDILKELGERKQEQLLVGFVVEIQDVEYYVCKKFVVKNFDMIVVNDVKVNGVGFGVDMNIVIIFFKDGCKCEFLIMLKFDVFFEIFQEIVVFLK